MTSKIDRAQFLRAAGAVAVVAATGQSMAEGAYKSSWPEATLKQLRHPSLLLFLAQSQCFIRALRQHPHELLGVLIDHFKERLRDATAPSDEHLIIGTGPNQGL